MSSPHVHIYADTNQVITELTRWIAETAQEGIRDRGVSHWAISGGSTPIPLYEQLAFRASTIPWPKVFLYFADERDVYWTDPLSNYHMVQDTLFNSLQVASSRVYPWPVAGDPREALAWYRQALSWLPRHEGYPSLDMALLGMGGDGHTASVFPGSPQLNSNDWVAYGPGPNAWRFTLTLALLINARHVMFLATGSQKAARVRECLVEKNPNLPAAIVSQNASDVHWFLDADSAREL